MATSSVVKAYIILNYNIIVIIYRLSYEDSTHSHY